MFTQIKRDEKRLDTLREQLEVAVEIDYLELAFRICNEISDLGQKTRSGALRRMCTHVIESNGFKTYTLDNLHELRERFQAQSYN